MKKFKFLIKIIMISILSALLIIVASMIIPLIAIFAIPFIGYGAYRMYALSLEADKDTTILDHEDKP